VHAHAHIHMCTHTHTHIHTRTHARTHTSTRRYNDKVDSVAYMVNVLGQTERVRGFLMERARSKGGLPRRPIVGTAVGVRVRACVLCVRACEHVCVCVCVRMCVCASLFSVCMCVPPL